MSSNITAYHPTSAVIAAHNIPHLTRSLQLTSGNFDPTLAYAESVGGLPGILFVLGILSLFCYHFVCCCCKCKSCLWVENVEEGTTEVDEKVVSKIKFRRRLTILSYLLFLGFLVVSNNIFLQGNKDISQGVNHANDALTFLKTTSQTLLGDSESISATGSQMKDLLNSAQTQCSYANEGVQYVDQMIDAGNSMSSMLNGIPDNIQTFQDDLQHYAVKMKNQSVWVAYYVVWGIIALYLLGLLLQSKTYLRGVIAFGGLIVLALTIICCVEMVVVTVLGDFCMDPTNNVLKHAPAGTNDTVAYYTTCNGKNPLADQEAQALNYTAQLRHELDLVINTYNPLAPGCYHNTQLEQCYNLTNTVYRDLYSINNSTDCAPIQNQWDSVVNEGLCTYFFRGFFTIWISEFVTSGCLFFLNVIAAVLFQYFTRIMWNIGSNKFSLQAFSSTGEILYTTDGDVELAEPSAPSHEDDEYGEVIKPDQGVFVEDAVVEPGRNGYMEVSSGKHMI